jgi:hypothetical protein
LVVVLTKIVSDVDYWRPVSLGDFAADIVCEVLSHLNECHLDPAIGPLWEIRVTHALEFTASRPEVERDLYRLPIAGGVNWVNVSSSDFAFRHVEVERTAVILLVSTGF